MAKKVKIFISSTFKDMNAERDVLIKNVFPRLREKAEGMGLRVQETDLRWGITEEQMKATAAADLCLDSIEECKPYFLCVLGKRYGWIPAPFFIPRGDFERIISGTSSLTAPEKDLLRKAYQLWDEQDRVYRLDLMFPNEERVKAQRILEKAGLYEAGLSITEQEIIHALSDDTLPRFIPELDILISHPPDEVDIGKEEEELIKTFYIRTGSERIWWLQPGEMPEERKRIREILEKLNHVPEYHSFFFFRRDAGEDHPDYVEADKSTRQKLDKLRARIEKSEKPVSVKDYPCRWEPQNIPEEETGRYPIQSLDEFEKMVFNLIWEHIKQNPELMVEEVEKGELEKEHDFHLRFIDSRTHNFCGRKELLGKIEESVNLALAGELRVDDSATQYIMVSGESGSGKSALLAQFQTQYQEKHRDRLIIPRFIGASSRSTNPRNLLIDFCKILAEERATKEEAPPELEIPSDLIELKRIFFEFLEKTDRNVVIILDAVNQLQKEERAREMEWLPDFLPDSTCIVMSLIEDTRKKKENDIEVDTTALDALRKRRIPPFEINVGRLSQEEKEEIIISYLRQYNKQLTPALLSELAQKEEAYNPLYLQAALEELRMVSRHEQLKDFIFDILPQTVVEMFAFVLQRVEKDLTHRFGQDKKRLFKDFMVFIATGRSGMTEEDLRLLLSEWSRLEELGGEQVRLSDFHWGELRRAMRPYLFTRGEEWDFFHQQLKEAVGRKYLEEVAPRLDAHRNIADYLEFMGYDHLTTVKDLAHHLLKVALGKGEDTPEWRRIEKVLTDLRFLEAKCAAGMTYDLIADYDAAIHALPEGREEEQRELGQVNHVKKYTEDIIAYASTDDIPLPQPIPSVEVWNTEKFKQENERRIIAPRLLDRIQAFSQFVTSESHALLKFGSVPRFCIQHAFNSARSGPVARAAEEIIAQEKDAILFLNSLSQRPEFVPRPVLLKTMEGHTSWVNGVSITPDGSSALSAGDKTIRMWNLETGACMKILEGHAGKVESVSVTPDARIAVSAGGRELIVWDLETGSILKTLEGHKGHVWSVSVTPEGRKVVSACEDRSIRIWDIETGSCLMSLEGHTAPVKSVCITPDGKRAVSASQDRTVRIWNLERSFCIKVIEEHTDAVNCVSITPDGKIAISGSRDRTLRVWDIETGLCLQTLTGFSGGINSVSMTPDGKIAVSASEDKILRVWNLESGSCLKVLEGHTDSVFCVSITPDARKAASGSRDRTIRLWNVESGSYEKTSESHNDDVLSVDVTPEGKKAVSASRDNTIRVWDIETGSCFKTLEGHTASIHDIRLAPDSRKAISASMDWTLRVWDIESGTCLRILEGHDNGVLCVAVTPDGRKAVSGSRDHTLRVWDIESGSCLKILKGHTGIIHRVIITPDSSKAVSASRDNSLRVWDIKRGSCLKILEGHNDDVLCVNLTADCSKVVSGSKDTTIKIWDLKSGASLKTLGFWLSRQIGHSDWIVSACITPDSKKVISASWDKTLRVWDIESGSCLKILQGHTKIVTDVILTLDGRKAISTSRDKTLRLWDLESGEFLAVYQAPGDIHTLSMIQESGKFITGLFTGQIMIINFQT